MDLHNGSYGFSSKRATRSVDATQQSTTQPPLPSKLTASPLILSSPLLTFS